MLSAVFILFAPAMVADLPTDDPAVSWAWAKAKAENDNAAIAWAFAKAKSEAKEVRPCYCGPDCKCASCDGKNCKCSQSECYTSLRGRSIAEHKPLIVGVGYEPIKVDGMLSVRYDAMPGVKGPAIVVGNPVGANLLMAGTLSSKATAADVRGLLAPKPVALPQPY